jgi:hypothetical protein
MVSIAMDGNNDIYIGGEFTSPGTTDYIVQWTGSAWQQVTSGLEGCEWRGWDRTCVYCGNEWTGYACRCSAPTPKWWARLDAMIREWKRGDA